MNIHKKVGGYVATVRLPRFTRKDIKISTKYGMLEVRAKHTENSKHQSQSHFHMKEIERSYLRRLPLPQGVRAQNVTFTVSDGMLTIDMPSDKSIQSKSVQVVSDKRVI